MSTPGVLPAGLLVGWGAADITPPGTVQVHGQFYERISEYVRDPITATALALEKPCSDGPPVRAVIVSCDLTNIPTELQADVRRIVAARVADLDVATVFLAATHTHNSPVTQPGSHPDPEPGVMHPLDYSAFAADRIADAVETAWSERRAGGVSWALTHAALGYNRRIVYEDGSARMYGPANTPSFRGLEGTCDHGVELLFCWDEARELTGLVINVSCPSQVVMTTNFISADYWQAARTALRDALGAGLQVLPLCGAAGDQCPVDHVRRGRAHAVGHNEAGLEELGRRVTLAVLDAVEEASGSITYDPPLAHIVEKLELPGRRVSRAEWQAARETYEGLVADDPPGGSSAVGRARRLLNVIARYHNQTEEPVFPMELHVIRLGDVALATNPFELFLDYGLRIKARSVAEQTFIAQLACDRGAYLPTTKAVEGGSYGAGLSEAPVGPEGGEVLVERTVELINCLWCVDNEGEDDE